MKRYISIIAILLITLLCNSCSVWKAERQYRVKKLQRAEELLTFQPQYADSLGRKSGIVSNMDRYRPIRIVIFNKEPKEIKSYFLAPGQWLRSYLIGGDYEAVAYYENREVSRWEFEVKPDTHSYMGNEVHWYLVYSNGY